jgi:AcrR family transcriptional regulator
MKTRERILHTSLALFNELGEPNVTTLLIADELDISPGNLYYHFKSKIEIIDELFSWYEQDLLSILDVPEEAMDIEDEWLFLHLIFETVAKYQFVYKDLVNLLREYDHLNPRFQRILKKKRLSCMQVLSNARELEHLRASDDELSALGENLIVTATFWLNYSIIANQEDTESALMKGVYQVMSLVAPFMEAERRDMLNALKEAYL